MARRSAARPRSTRPRRPPRNPEPPMPMQQLALFFLATAAVGGVAWVFLYPLLSGERQAEKRMENVSRTDRVATAKATRTTPKVRRDQLENTLKELETRRKKQKNP